MIADEETGIVPCTLLEVTPAAEQLCDPSRGRATPTPAFLDKVCGQERLPSCSAMRVCELRRASEACHHVGLPTEVGWCYIDPSQNPGDDPALVATCAANEKRRIRIVDPELQTPAPGAYMLIACWNRR
jgi:hypothetical protein